MIILAFNGGKFRICIPLVSGVRIRERFRTVGRAVVRIAETVEAEIEVSQKKHLLSVWVYYTHSGKKWSTVYFDYGKNWREDEVFNSIRGEVSRLSPHHENLILQSERVR